MNAPKNKGLTVKINNKEMYEFFRLIVDDECFWMKDVGLQNVEECMGESGFSISSYMDVFNNFNNLQLIYTKEDSEKQIGMVQDLQSIFGRYFKIPGLERLIANNYTDIEWSMFLEQNFEKNEPKRTRDHFQHQFRNAFLGCILLYRFDFINNILKCIDNKETVFSYLVNMAIEKQVKKINNKESEEDMQVKRESYEREIVFKSYLLAAMFHDVGYPIEYYLRESRQIQKFTPFYKIINSNIKTDFVEIKSILIDSQLFSIVDNDEIEEKYNNNDHGVLSAISFLFNFYLSGSIFSMSDIDRTIIEIAAVAIYKHTNKYKGSKRMVFNDDPISYLLRLCDDLQEWSRFSLCINNVSNILRCKCNGMVVRDDLSEKNGNVQYRCQLCGDTFTKITSLEYKKIHYLSLCEEMQVWQEDDITNIEIKYDLFKQLELLLNDYTSVKYRNDDLQKVIDYLEFQKNLPNINIIKFLSNNPVILTKKILGCAINEQVSIELLNENIRYKAIIAKMLEEDKEKSISRKMLYDFIQEINNFSEYSNKEIETDVIKYSEKSKRFVCKYIGLIKAFYDCNIEIG
jgi:hypothetical protein